MSGEEKVVNINIRGEVLSPYAEDGMEVIGGEFANFLDNSVKDISVKNNILLEISSKDCDVDRVGKAIKNYYRNEMRDSERRLRQNLMFSIINLMIGLLALAVNVVLAVVEAPALVCGALDIFAWVFVWEAVDLFFFRRVELKYNKRRQKNFVEAKIVNK